MEDQFVSSFRGICNVLIFVCMFTACDTVTDPVSEPGDDPQPDGSAIEAMFQGRIDLSQLPNYANQDIPGYIDKDNTENNEIDDMAATLGRVLFYDVKLSVDETISCATCHQQEHAFGDPDRFSEGVNGITGRHSMRLINARFGDEEEFFWDERANSLEQQTTQPIQDHIEMGFSGEQGNPNLDDLIQRLSGQGYYQELFTEAFGDPGITEQRMQLAMAQFIRSIQSFDSKYDAGRSQVNNNGADFPNFTAQENLGKALFQQDSQFGQNGRDRVGGGLGCGDCHRPPEFDIRPGSGNNGVTGAGNGMGNADFDVTRSPTLRDMFNAGGELHTPLMHTGSFETFDEVLTHYGNIPRGGNPGLDRRLDRGGDGVNLNLTRAERDAVIAFLKTLTGSDVYTNEKWSNPFE